MKKNICYLLVSLVIAFGLWAYVVTAVSPESEDTFYNIPVEWDAESEAILKDKGLMVVSGEKPKVTLRLRGNRSDLNNLKNSDITVIADLAKINTAGEQALRYNVYFTGSNAFEIVNQSPQLLTLQIAEWATKDVPVEVKYEGTVGSDHIAFFDDVIPNPSAITITGPKSVVDRVAKAVVKVDLDGKTETLSLTERATLCNSDGEPVDVAAITADGEVKLTVRILRVKELPLRVTPIYGGGVNGGNSTLILDYTSIKVAGSENILAALPDVLELGQINLAEITENTVLTFPITGGMLQGAENLSGITEIHVAVTVPERITRDIEITDMSRIEVTGLPQGMTMQYVTRKFTVTLIGREDQVNAMTANDFSISIDLTGVEPDNNQAIKAVVTVSPGYPDVEGSVNQAITVDIAMLAAHMGGLS